MDNQSIKLGGLSVDYLMVALGRCSKFAGKRQSMFSSRLQDMKKMRMPTEQSPGNPSGSASAQSMANNFSNDGSFMEQFYKMQGIKCEFFAVYSSF